MRQQGFTLIETLVYLGLLAIMMAGLLGSTFAILQNTGRTQTKAMVQEEGSFLLAKLNWVMTGAGNVTQPASGSSDDTLSLTKGGTVYTVSLNSGDLTLQGSALSNTNVTVLAPTTSPTFVFTHTGSGSDPEFITTSFTLETKTPTGQIYSQDFTTTKYLRK